MNNTNELTAKLKAAAPYEMKFSRLWERYDEACHGNAEHMRDILEITLDALETAERRIANSDRDVRALTEALEAAEKRIAELEARTLSVKLPKPRRVKLVTGEWANGWTAYDAACAITNAGFSLKIEGE